MKFFLLHVHIFYKKKIHNGLFVTHLRGVVANVAGDRPLANVCSLPTSVIHIEYDSFCQNILK